MFYFFCLKKEFFLKKSKLKKFLLNADVAFKNNKNTLSLTDFLNMTNLFLFYQIDSTR